MSHRLGNGNLAYHSRTLSKSRRGYAQIDREALALIVGVKKFYNYLYGRHFELITDPKPLLGIMSEHRPTLEVISPRMLRWTLTFKSIRLCLKVFYGR